MTFLRSMCLAGAIFAITGCTWQKLPPTPVYTLEAPIPLRVGVMLANQSADQYDSPVLDEWKKMQLFDSFVYPYKDGDPVDVVIRLTTSGSWDTSLTAGDLAGNVLVGATLGLLGSAIPSETWRGTHEAIAIINKTDNDEIGRYTVNVTSTVENARHFIFGEGPYKEHAANANQIQAKRLAYELATKIRADRQGLVQRLKK